MAQAMKSSTKIMATGNKAMNVQKMQETMMQFDKESTAMDMKEEISKLLDIIDVERLNQFIKLRIVNDTLDGVMEGSDDEQEGEDIMNQVLDEIGIDFSTKVCRYPLDCRLRDLNPMIRHQQFRQLDWEARVQKNWLHQRMMTWNAVWLVCLNEGNA
jgi:ribosomal protein L17